MKQFHGKSIYDLSLGELDYVVAVAAGFHSPVLHRERRSAGIETWCWLSYGDVKAYQPTQNFQALAPLLCQFEVCFTSSDNGKLAAACHAFEVQKCVTGDTVLIAACRAIASDTFDFFKECEK